MCRSGVTPFFISAVGDDVNGQSIVDALREIGMVRISLSLIHSLTPPPPPPPPPPQCVSGIFKSPSISTASYCVLLSSQGEMTCGVGDMDIHSTITPEWARNNTHLSPHTISQLIYVCMNISLN